MALLDEGETCGEDWKSRVIGGAAAHASLRDGYLFADMLVLHQPKEYVTQIMPLVNLLVLTSVCVRCPNLHGVQALPLAYTRRSVRPTARGSRPSRTPSVPLTWMPRGRAL